MKVEINRVEYLLSMGLPVLIYNGQMDLIVSTPGTMRWAEKIFYKDASEFKKKLFDAWKINGKMVGTMKSAGLLEMRIVFNAGHMVPMDQPEAALDMATAFVKKVIG